MHLIPRDYQEYGITQFFQYFAEKDGHPLFVYPTGTGKSVLIAEICRRALERWPDARIIMATHSKELVEQNFNKLKLAWPEAPAGIFCNGLGRKEHYYPITFGTVQSMAGYEQLFGCVHFLLVDECDLISDDENSQYRIFIKELQRYNDMLKVAGFTATHYRQKQGLLINGESPLFTDIAVDCTSLEAFNWFFDQGYLVPPIPKPTKNTINTDSVAIIGGEYNQKQLQEVSNTEAIRRMIVEEMIREGKNRYHWLVFAAGVQGCADLHEMFQQYGIDSTWVASRGMATSERDKRIREYRDDHKYQVMINNGILTVGYDDPNIDLIGMGRKTRSPRLWVQMLGRGTRPVFADGFDLTEQAGRLDAIAASYKHNCLVLDFAGNTRDLGPINAVQIPKQRAKGAPGDAPVRICSDIFDKDGTITRTGCGCYNHASARICWNCQLEFPVSSAIEGSASTLALVKKLQEQPVPGLVLPISEWQPVDRVVYINWEKPGKPDSIKVMYHCGRRMFAEWVCLEHAGPAKHIARNWWKLRDEVENDEIPQTTARALELVDSIKQPKRIYVVTNKPHGEISDYEF